jgi:PKD repeat protein
MFKKLCVLLIFACFINQAQSQKESFNWIFGYYGGLDFNYKPPHLIPCGIPNASAGCGTISDLNGNLLFYTDGQNVYNKNHNLMKNGGNIGGQNNALQSGLIIPKPGSKNLYYIFSNNQSSGNFSYSIVDIYKQSGFGEVVSKNNILILSNGTEKVTAVSHYNHIDVWVITHKAKSDAFYAYLVTGNGILKNPIISNCGFFYPNTQSRKGQIKVSTDGSLLVNAIHDEGFEVFHFDNRIGVITGPKFSVMDKRNYTGTEFSPNIHFLYMTDNGGPLPNNNRCIWQYDLNSDSINIFIGSKVLLATTKFTVGTCQIAVDGIIYIGSTDSCIHSIDNPNIKGFSCNFIDKVFCYDPPAGYCFPDFLQSYFYRPDFKSENLCLGDTTQFILTDTTWVDSVYWDFNDIASGIKNHSRVFEPKHFFADTGIYKVKIIVYRDTIVDTFARNIRISLYPSAVFIVSDTALCLKDNHFSFTNASSINIGNITYDWDFGDGDTNKQFTTDAMHSYLKDSTYKVRLVAISDYGCMDTAYKQITVYPTPKPDFTISDTMLCLKNNVFNFNNKTLNFKPGTLNFLWSFGDSLSDTTFNTIYSYNYADTFNVNLFITTDKGCKDTAGRKIIVLPSPKADFSVNDTSQCFKTNFFNFTNLSTISQGTLNYNWDFGNSKTSAVKDTSFGYNTTRIYSIRQIAISDKACTDTAFKKIYVNPEPQAAFTLNDSIQCFSWNKFIFTNHTTITNDTFYSYWDCGDSVYTDTLFSPVYIYTKTGNFTVKLLTISTYGCKDSAFKKVAVYPQSAILSATHSYVCDSGSTTLTATAKNGTILWYDSITGGSLLDTGSIYTTPMLHNTTTYYLEARNTGCYSSPRNPVTAFVTPTPIIISTIPASNKGPGSVILRATASSGDVNWYNDSLAGSWLTSDTVFATPIINVTTKYFVDASENGCISKNRTGVTAMILPNSIKENRFLEGIKIYPNPAVTRLSISLPALKNDLTLRILNTIGKEIYSSILNTNQTGTIQSIDLSGFASGMYFLILSDNSKIRVEKVIRE